MKKSENKKDMEKISRRWREKERFLPSFLSNLVADKWLRATFFFILSLNTIKLPADILITLENSLIIFSISQGENKICSIENKISPWEIENKPILVMRQNCVISIRRSFSWILNHSRVLRMRIFFTNLFFRCPSYYYMKA